MEQRIWLLLIIVMVSGFAVIMMGAAIAYQQKCIKTLTSRVADLDQWSMCIDRSLDPATKHRLITEFTSLDKKRRGL